MTMKRTGPGKGWMLAQFVLLCLLGHGSSIAVEASHDHHTIKTAVHHRHWRLPSLSTGKESAGEHLLDHNHSPQKAPSTQGGANNYWHYFDLRRSREHLRQPEDVEHANLILGVPKVIWVILADVLAMAVFVSLVPLVMKLSKRNVVRGDSAAKHESDSFCMCL
mmetsp:Transcript_52776/g.123441  ORF Transcript_52776/g.123441 Transcript_52776/m.123441 type:complete len:164 (-) Transcript_52776:25-516(-)